MIRRLLHYEILREIGRGGMGIVYQARDARLGRTVALKILPADKVAYAARKQRFIQEARAASALNHPNIITVHDVNAEDGVDFLVMEFVEGRPLDDVIPAKGLRPSVALKYAIQMADALAAAHAAGIVHRDLKPSNVMVTGDGRIKVLDFGLAKLTDPAESSADDSTFSARPLTGEGAVMGTAPYMSPEQAEGRKLDNRSDIFSFGSVLYEMLTGHKPFTGDSRFSTLAKILNEEPRPVGQLAPAVPPDLAKLVARCLRKDPSRRFQVMADVKVALEDVQEESASGPHVAAARSSRSRQWALVAALPILITAGAVGWRHTRGADPAEPSRILPLTAFEGAETHPTLAPDGNHVAFTWSGPKQDNDDIYVQLIGSGGPLRVTSDPSADFSPAWSPDGRWIAFLRGATPGPCELRLVPPLGGPERLLGEVHVRHSYVWPPYLSWFPDSTSLVVVDSAGPKSPDSLFVVSVETGEKRPLTTPEPPVIADTNPAVSPDGRTVVFHRHPSAELYSLALRTDRTPAGTPRRVTEAPMNAQQPAWLPDGRHIVVSSQGALWKVDVSGSRAPARVFSAGDNPAMPVLSRPQPGRAARLVYVRSSPDANIWRVTTTAPGAPAPSPPVPSISSTRRELNAQFSPDGRRVAFFSNRSGTGEIWLSDPDGSNAVQLTSMQAPSSGTPRWSPDGRTIAFDSNLGGQYDVYVVSSSGGKPRRVTTHAADDHVPSFSRDGKWIYFSSSRGGDFQIWKVDVSGGDPVQVTRNGGFVAFESPDGRHVYYTQTSTSSSTLWRLAVSGGEPVKVLEGVAQRSFAVLDTGIYYIDQGSGVTGGPPAANAAAARPGAREAQLRFFDFVTRASRTVSALGERITIGLTASRDGRTILYSRQDQPMSDLMLVENFR